MVLSEEFIYTKVRKGEGMFRRRGGFQGGVVSYQAGLLLRVPLYQPFSVKECVLLVFVVPSKHCLGGYMRV